jgi:hypothetical protein
MFADGPNNVLFIFVVPPNHTDRCMSKVSPLVLVSRVHRCPDIHTRDRADRPRRQQQYNDQRNPTLIASPTCA